MNAKRKSKSRAKKRKQTRQNLKDDNEKPRNSSFVIEGIPISEQYIDLREARYFRQNDHWCEQKDHWCLCTQNRQIVATFKTLAALQGWWDIFLFRTGKEHCKVKPFNPEKSTKKKRPNKNVVKKKQQNKNVTKKKQKKRKKKLPLPLRVTAAKPSVIRRGGGRAPTTNSAPDRIHWNDEYDMPEF